MRRLALAALLLVSAPLRSEGLTPTAAGRPLLGSTARLCFIDYPLSPIRLQAWDLAWLVPAGAGLAVILNNDVPLYRRLREDDLHPDQQAGLMHWASTLGEGLPLAGGAALAWGGGALFGQPRLASSSATALQALAVAGVWSTAFKYAAWSNRPSQDDGLHRFWAFDQSSTGFPSGHSFAAFAAAEAYGAEYGRWTYLLAGLVAYSRIYNGAHWPSDVFAGSLLGVAAGWQARRATGQDGPPQWRWGLRQGDGAPLLIASTAF